MKQSKNRVGKFPEPIDIKADDIIIKYGISEGGGEGNLKYIK